MEKSPQCGERKRRRFPCSEVKSDQAFAAAVAAIAPSSHSKKVKRRNSEAPASLGSAWPPKSRRRLCYKQGCRSWKSLILCTDLVGFIGLCGYFTFWCLFCFSKYTSGHRHTSLTFFSTSGCMWFRTPKRNRSRRRFSELARQVLRATGGSKGLDV